MKSILFLLAIALPAMAAPVQFAWEASPDAGCSNTVLWGRTGALTNRIAVGTNQMATLTNAPGGVLSACVVATLDGIDSEPSNVVAWTNAPAAPARFRLIQSLQSAASPGGPWQEVGTLQSLAVPAGASQFFRSSVLIQPLPPQP